MGFIGGALEAFNGDPKFNTLDNVKSQPFQHAINAGLADYNNFVPSTTHTYDNWLAQYNAGNPAAAANTSQETNAIGGYYDGSVAGQLAALAANRQNAVLNAARLAQQQALLGSHMSLLDQGGAGMNSYNTGLLARNYANIATQAALDHAQQQQQNYQQVLGGQIGMAGQRTNLANALAMRALQPYQVRSGMLTNNQGMLNNLLSMNNANNIYGIQQHKNTLDQLSAFANAADSGIMNTVSTLGSVVGDIMGTGGGGGKGGSSIPNGASPNGGGFQMANTGFGSPSNWYSGPTSLTLNSGQQYNPSGFSNSDVWGSAQPPQYGGAGGGGFMGSPMGAGSAASGFGAGGDAFSIGGGYGQ